MEKSIIVQAIHDFDGQAMMAQQAQLAKVGNI
jgi:hypothetical protein